MPSTIREGNHAVLHWSLCVVERREKNSMPCGNCLDLVNPPRRDEPSSLGKGLEPALQSKSHTFQQTSMDHIGERMPIQNSMKIRRESQSASDLSQTSEEDFEASQLLLWRQVLRIARIANDCVRRDAAQQKRRGRQTRRADHDIGLGGKSLKIRPDLHLNSIGF